MRLGLVLGAGGVAGMNYHAGVLHALTEVGGLDPASADLVVGTSAGSVMGALLRSGWTANDCWEFALGIHPDVIELEDEEVERRARAVFTPRSTNPLDLARRAVGSSYVIGRSLVRTPMPPVHPIVARQLAKVFPGGLFSTAESEAQFAEILPEAWPEQPLWLVAVDIGSGRRVVLGRRGAPEVSLHDGVLASCSIPGVYSPVRAGPMTLVDGGAHSTTNLDLAVRAGCETVIGIAPMAYDPASPPPAIVQLERRRATRSLATEARVARGKGTDVLLIRPTAPELVIHGRRLMRPTDGPAIALAAFDATATFLETPRFRAVFEHPPTPPPDLPTVIRRRRMVRAYEDRPVPDDVLDRILDLARRAPSAGNSQGVDFVVLTGDGVARYWSITLDDPASFSLPGLVATPVLVLPLVSAERYTDRYSEPDKAQHGLGDASAWPVPYWWVDGGMAVENLLLACVAEGLGACFFGMFDHEPDVMAWLGVPSDRRALGTISLGYPAPDPPGLSASRPRRPLDEVVHRGRW